MILDRLFEKPINVMLVIFAVATLFCGFLLAVGTFLRWSRTELEVLLLIFGVMAILIIIIRSDNAIAITIAVLIVGTVVAGERFLLSVTALIGGASDEGRKFVTDVYGSNKNPIRRDSDDAKLAQMIVERINAAQATGSEPREVVETFIREARVQEAVQDVRLTSSETPLLRLHKGDDWGSFVEEFEGNRFFNRDMHQLLELGLITFSGSNFADAKITELGRRAARILEESPFERAISRSELELGPSINNVKSEDMNTIKPGEAPIEAQFGRFARVWFELEIEERGEYIISTGEGGDVASDVDTIVSIFGEDKVLMAEDDDSGEWLFSEIKIELKAGRYYISVKNLDRSKGGFILQVNKG